MTTLVGIVNLTPDSFSGDGLQFDPDKAMSQINGFIKDGAGVVDIGAESTRPGANLLSPEEEWQRFEPVMNSIKQKIGQVCFSIDTRHSETARKFLQYFPKEKSSSIFINDVSSGTNENMISLAEKYGVRLIVTHSLSIPADPKITLAENADATEVIYDWAKQQIKNIGKNIIIDPGIGFGKTASQSLAIIKNIARIKSLGAEVMVGHSRKSFLSLFADKKASERDPETLIISNYLIDQGVDYLRVHDVKNHALMLKIRRAL